MDRETKAQPGPDVAPPPSPEGNGHEDEAKAESGAIWIVNDRTSAAVRSRFYKAILLGLSCIFQLVIAGEILQMYGPFTFLAFTLGITICAGIAMQEVGALLSAIDMDFGVLKRALFDRESPRESPGDQSDLPQATRA